MSRSLLLGAVLLGLFGCATYRDDFDRARAHYDANEYDRALVLLEVLERDIDSLSEPERAQYAYFRGMSHLRLQQPKDARHWLANAVARETASQGALVGDTKARATDALKTLSAPYYGESTDDADGHTCKTDLDCDGGGYCDAGQCAGEKSGAGGKSGAGEKSGAGGKRGEGRDDKAMSSSASDAGEATGETEGPSSKKKGSMKMPSTPNKSRSADDD